MYHHNEHFLSVRISNLSNRLFLPQTTDCGWPRCVSQRIRKILVNSPQNWVIFCSFLHSSGQASISDAERRHYSELASQILYTPASQLPPAGRRLTEAIGEPKFTTFLADLSPHQLFIDQLWQHRHRLVASSELLATLIVAAPVCWPEACRRASQPTTKSAHDKILWMLLLSQLYR